MSHEILRPGAHAHDSLDTHKVPGELISLDIHVLGEIGPGGAHNRYDISGFDSGKNTAGYAERRYVQPFQETILLFQNGPLVDGDANGITIESLLAVCIHRLEGFQAGPFPCAENQVALDKTKEALASLKARTAALLAP